MRVRMKATRKKRMKVMRRMTGTRVVLMREPSKMEVQEALGMGMPVRLYFLRCELSTISCR